MLRALSTRRSPCDYEKLEDEARDSLLECKNLTRSTTVPSNSQGYPFNRFPPDSKSVWPKPDVKPHNPTHPLLNLFDVRRKKKKATAKPEFARYVEYLREGGVWDPSSNKPIIHYK